MLEGLPLRRDGVLAVPVRVPGGRTPVPAPLFEFGPMLLVDEVNALGTVDVGNARQLRAIQPLELDRYPHHATVAHISEFLRLIEPVDLSRLVNEEFHAAS